MPDDVTPQHTDSKLSNALVGASEGMQSLLRDATGLEDFDRKLITAWALATHALPSQWEFPLLMLWGKSHTGKSTTQEIVSRFCRKPLCISMRGMSSAMIRDKFVEAKDGTIIVDEADAAWKDGENRFEQLLSDRFSRTTAVESHKAQSNDKGAWKSQTNSYFGATCVHRRKPFHDIALDNRALIIPFSPVYGRDLIDIPKAQPCQLSGFTFQLPEIKRPSGIAGRVFTCYRPILAMLQMFEDLEFEKKLLLRMMMDTESLKEAQQMEPDSLVLAALMSMIYCVEGQARVGNFRLADIAQAIVEENGAAYALDAKQVGKICRDTFGFKTVRSHGVYNVTIPTEPSFLTACSKSGYDDEGLMKRREKYPELKKDIQARAKSTLSTQ